MSGRVSVPCWHATPVKTPVKTTDNRFAVLLTKYGTIVDFKTENECHQTTSLSTVLFDCMQQHMKGCTDNLFSKLELIMLIFTFMSIACFTIRKIVCVTLWLCVF